MFRAENVQAGRYRQFHQLDVEAFGMNSPSIDVEILELAVRYLEACGVSDCEVVLNSVGDANCRPAYVERLREALRANLGRLGADSRRRTETNPLRVLDSKAEQEQELIAALPKIADALCPECREHFAEVRRQLELLGISHRVEPRLVRGLDYYVGTTFEVTSRGLGAQNSVLGGGRYDGLVKQLGGPDVAGTGFALGLERLLALTPAGAAGPRCEVFLAPLSKPALERSLTLQQQLRAAGMPVLMDHEGRGLKAKLKLADKLGARFALLLGDDELAKGVWTVRDMKGSSQETVADSAVVAYLKEKLANG
jgi:histidyl-tRNA synthetase